MMTGWGFVFPKEQRQYHGRDGSISGIVWSRNYRAHVPESAEEQLDDVWELGEDIAWNCGGFRNFDDTNPEKSCANCASLPSCTGEKQEVRPDLFRLIKGAFAHDLIPE